MKSRQKCRHIGATNFNQASVDSASKPACDLEKTQEASGPRQVIEQAARDISRGLRDTDLHGTPSNVPGPGPQPEHSPGAEVPPEGVNVHK